MSSPTPNITSVLKETRQFPPPADFAAHAHIKSAAEYRAALAVGGGRSRRLLGRTGRAADLVQEMAPGAGLE